MARPSLNDDTKTFLGKLRGATGAVGNMSLRSALGWSDSRYWRVHSMLIESGRIVRGRGRGGSVAKAGR